MAPVPNIKFLPLQMISCSVVFAVWKMMALDSQIHLDFRTGLRLVQRSVYDRSDTGMKRLDFHIKYSRMPVASLSHVRLAALEAMAP